MAFSMSLYFEKLKNPINYLIKSSTLTPKAFATFLSVTNVGFWFSPDSILISVLLETSANLANFSCESPLASRNFFILFAKFWLPQNRSIFLIPNKLLLVPGRGLEPPRGFPHQLLRLACLPFHHPGFVKNSTSFSAKLELF